MTFRLQIWPNHAWLATSCSEHIGKQKVPPSGGCASQGWQGFTLGTRHWERTGWSHVIKVNRWSLTLTFKFIIRKKNFFLLPMAPPLLVFFWNWKVLFTLYNNYLQNTVLLVSQIFCWASQWDQTAGFLATTNVCICVHVCVCSLVSSSRTINQCSANFLKHNPHLHPSTRNWMKDKQTLAPRFSIQDPSKGIGSRLKPALQGLHFLRMKEGCLNWISCFRLQCVIHLYYSSSFALWEENASQCLMNARDLGIPDSWVLISHIQFPWHRKIERKHFGHSCIRSQKPEIEQNMDVSFCCWSLREREKEL